MVVGIVLVSVFPMAIQFVKERRARAARSKDTTRR